MNTPSSEPIGAAPPSSHEDQTGHRLVVSAMDDGRMSASEHYIGVTGFMSADEVRAALAEFPACGRRLMVGVLVSEKTIAHQRNRWHRRYPSVAAIRHIFIDDPRCMNILHFASSTPPSWSTLKLLLDVAGPRCHGFQWNGAWPLPADRLGMETRAGRSLCHILQLRTDPRVHTTSPRAFGPWPCELERRRATHVLLDASGGAGRLFAPERAKLLVEQAREELGPAVGVVVAGGLDAESVPLFRDVLRSVSIDAESRLRDGPDGGDMNLKKVAAYLSSAGKALVP